MGKALASEYAPKGIQVNMISPSMMEMRFLANVYGGVVEQTAAAYVLHPLPEKALLLTFDDGYIDNFTVAFPLLKERKMQGAFFIPGKTITENVLLDVNKIHFVLASADIELLVKDVLERMNHYRSGGYVYADNDELWDKYAVANRFDAKEIVFVKRILQTVLPEELRNIIASEMFAKYVGLPEDKFARELYMNHDQVRLMR